MPWPKEVPAKRYPSDLTDEEWAIVEPLLKELDPYKTGRPALLRWVSRLRLRQEAWPWIHEDGL